MRPSDCLFWLLRALARLQTYRRLRDPLLRRQTALVARHHFREYARRMLIRLTFAELREVTR